jgi:hypothetical protein
MTLRLLQHRITANLTDVKALNSQVGDVLDLWNSNFLTDPKVFIVYHVGTLVADDSRVMNEINIKIFLSSLAGHSLVKSTFVLINIKDAATNVLLQTVKSFVTSIPYHFCLHWASTDSDILTHALSIATIKRHLQTFDVVIALNQGVRGPLVHRGTWVSKFLTPLEIRNVMLAGPVISCEQAPHVQTHMFVFSTKILELFLQHELKAGNNWSEIVTVSEVGLTQQVIKSGFRVSSLLYRNRWGEMFFGGSCRPELGTKNPSGWCKLDYREVLFVKWGGEYYRQKLYCPRIVNMIDSVTASLLSHE